MEYYLAPVAYRTTRESSVRPIDRDLEGVHVLLVDDNEDALELFGSSLRRAGAVVTVARDGEQALGYLNLVRAHVIVTLSMPGIDGMEFVSRLRGQRGQHQAPTPVIAVTAFTDQYNLRHTKDAGFSSYLVKPVDPARVAREVRRIFDATYSLLGDDGSSGSDHTPGRL